MPRTALKETFTSSKRETRTGQLPAVRLTPSELKIIRGNFKLWKRALPGVLSKKLSLSDYVRQVLLEDI